MKIRLCTKAVSCLVFPFLIAACTNNPTRTVTSLPKAIIAEVPTKVAVQSTPIAPTSQEIKAARRFERWDINGDGKISREEFRIAMIKRFYKQDKHKAGRLSADETAALRLPTGQKLPANGVTIAQFQAGVDRAFDQLDVNHNGYLTSEEFMQARRNKVKTMPLLPVPAMPSQPSGSQP